LMGIIIQNLPASAAIPPPPPEEMKSNCIPSSLSRPLPHFYMYKDAMRGAQRRRRTSQRCREGRGLRQELRSRESRLMLSRSGNCACRPLQ
jgi:hypothetical protein